MPESFGARLRRQREQQTIALATIAEQTKIKLSLLEGLERDDISHWPSGIFRRAYIRAYAHAIGLSPDAIVREFVELYPQPGEDLATISAAATETEARASGGPPMRLRYIVGSALDSLARFRRSPVKESPAPFEPAAETLTDSPAETLHVYHRDAIADDSPAIESPAIEAASTVPDLVAVAHVCTELACVQTADELKLLLADVAALLDATGLVIWLWDSSRAELRVALGHGYSDRVLAQLPALTRDADNVTAAAFRSADMCAINGTEHESGALVIPLFTPAGASGVLALEVQHGGEQSPSVRAVATIFAALLVQLIGDAAVDDGEGHIAVSSAS